MKESESNIDFPPPKKKIITVGCQHAHHGSGSFLENAELLDMVIESQLNRGCMPLIEDRLGDDKLEARLRQERREIIADHARRRKNKKRTGELLG